LPTFIESGVADFTADSWVGLLAPARTPPAVLNKLTVELNAVLNDPAVRERLAVLGIEPTPGSAEAFRQQMQKDLAAYGPIVKGAGIKLE
jgi:tripartite-type tricarboxylate transporter receptor subunit TctC